MPEIADDYTGLIGVTTQHLDGEDGGTVGWSFNLGGGRIVWCGELSRTSFQELEIEQREAMHNDFGWFLVIFDKKSHVVLGKAVDEFRAKELVELTARGLIGGVAIEA